MVNLWKSYRTNSIEIDYSSEEVQEAYLFRYYTLYHRVAYLFLKNNLNTMDTMLSKRLLQIMFLGSGPGPEIVALLSCMYKYYRDNERVTESIHISNIDSNKWEYGTSLCSDHYYSWYKNEFKKIGIKLNFFKRVDANLIKCLNGTGLVFNAKFDILYAQNLFNEIVDGINTQKFLNNFIKTGFNHGAVFFSSDRQNYQSVDNFFNNIRNSTLLNIISKEDVHTTSIYAIHSLLKSHLFSNESGLIASNNAYSTQRIFKINVSS
jgi:hypothetical protein